MSVMLRPALICALLLAAVPATAGPGRAPRPRGVGVHLDYERGPGTWQCPAANALFDEVAAKLGKDRLKEAGPWRLRATVNRKNKGGFVATADLFDSEGAQVLTLGEVASVDCPTLVMGLALWITTALTDPPLPLHPAPVAAPAPPVAAPVPVVAPASELAPPTVLPGAAPWQIRLGLGTTLGFGVAPRAAVGLTADIGVYFPVASVLFDGVSLMYGMRWDPPAAGYFPSHSKKVQVSTYRGLLFLDPCIHPGKFFACAVLGLGSLDNQSGYNALRTGKFASEDARRAAQETSSFSMLFVSGGRLGVEVPFLPHLGFRASGELDVNATSITIPVDERTDWTTPRVLGGVEVGLYVFE